MNIVKAWLLFVGLSALTTAASDYAAARWAALSMIESGDCDRAVGRAGEVSRYQIKPSIWLAEAKEGGLPSDPVYARRVAERILAKRMAVFVRSHGRPVMDKEFYVLWNAPSQAGRPSKIVMERAQRFDNLVKRLRHER